MPCRTYGQVVDAVGGVAPPAAQTPPVAGSYLMLYPVEVLTLLAGPAAEVLPVNDESHFRN